VRLRIFTEPQQGAEYETLLRVARATEDCGFDAFFRSDHYLRMGDVSGRPGPSDSWVTLAALARETSRIRLGTLMTAATFRLPGPLAVSVAGVDRMSGGRVELGMGAAWYEEESEAYGIPFPPVAERFDRLEEQLEILTGMWATPEGETFTYEGRHYRLVDCPALPKPANGRVPIIVGGTGPRRTPTLAARFADEFNVFDTLETTGPVLDRAREVCAELGRTRPLTCSVAQVVCCAESDAELRRRATAIGYPDLAELRAEGLVGSPAEVVDKLGRFAALGVETAYLQVLDLDDIAHVELLADQAAPRRAAGTGGAMDQDLAAQVADVAARVVASGAISANGHGNVSVRVPGSDEMYFTAGGSLRGHPASAVVRVGLDGTLREGELPPVQGAVVAMHTAIYADRDDVGCVIHTHSPFATAFAVARRPIGCWVEALAMFGLPAGVPVAEYGPRGSERAVANIRAAVSSGGPAVLLANHGVLVFHRTPDLAIAVGGIVEEAAQAAVHAAGIGGPVEIEPDLRAAALQRALAFESAGVARA
jgi:F420-dependent oxidoreductase-like protein